MNIQLGIITSDDELHQIIILQQKNLRQHRSEEIENAQGFVTVVHDMALLRSMNEKAAHVVAKDGDKVVGYALAMTRDFKLLIPALVPMFDLLENIMVDGQKVGSSDFLVMGQICIDEQYRGKGIFQQLYTYYFDRYKPIYGKIITEVAVRNARSLKAHLNIGFEEIHRYDEPGVEDWVVIMY
jgi:GNAT superfamily N-acetyltransferase